MINPHHCFLLIRSIFSNLSDIFVPDMFSAPPDHPVSSPFVSFLPLPIVRHNTSDLALLLNTSAIFTREIFSPNSLQPFPSLSLSSNPRTPVLALHILPLLFSFTLVFFQVISTLTPMGASPPPIRPLVKPPSPLL